MSVANRLNAGGTSMRRVWRIVGWLDDEFVKRVCPADYRHLTNGYPPLGDAFVGMPKVARGNRRRESLHSNQHRLLGEDTRHRALR
jgi:hypothetical protein